jgi:hypothetical protein
VIDDDGDIGAPGEAGLASVLAVGLKAHGCVRELLIALG